MIRFIEKKDVEAVYNIYKYYILNTSITFEIAVPTIEDFAIRIKNISKTHPYIVYELDNKVIGYAYATPYGDRQAYMWTLTSTIYVHHKYLNKGIGKILYKQLLELLKTQGFHTVFAIITSTNNNSMKFHLNIGFKYQFTLDNMGYKLGNWHDIIFYRYEISSPTNPPNSLISIEEVKILKKV
ncbi:MAG: hypothetical protein BEN18_00220 [Epulopiscium sp. Nuni2H_MBin001]|nr:MAG: hypothetical protein BEN18_00220 [Epulopiscium sp. Nuni2H_MBin001]